MQHKQLYLLFDEVHTTYFKECHDKLVNKKVLILLFSIK